MKCEVGMFPPRPCGKPAAVRVHAIRFAATRRYVGVDTRGLPMFEEDAPIWDERIPSVLMCQDHADRHIVNGCIGGEKVDNEVD